MNKHLRLPKFWIIAVAEAAIAVSAVAIWFYFRTSALLAVPPPPAGDLYAYNWGFQLIVFVVVWLPATLLLSGTFIAIQHQALKSRYGGQHSEGRGHAP